MQNELNIERSREGQQAQTLRIRPRWHMTVLHVVYYLIMVAFLVFYMCGGFGSLAVQGSGRRQRNTGGLWAKAEKPIEKFL